MCCRVGSRLRVGLSSREYGRFLVSCGDSPLPSTGLAERTSWAAPDAHVLSLSRPSPGHSDPSRLRHDPNHSRLRSIQVPLREIKTLKTRGVTLRRKNSASDRWDFAPARSSKCRQCRLWVATSAGERNTMLPKGLLRGCNGEWMLRGEAHIDKPCSMQKEKRAESRKPPRSIDRPGQPNRLGEGEVEAGPDLGSAREARP